MIPDLSQSILKQHGTIRQNNELSNIYFHEMVTQRVTRFEVPWGYDSCPYCM